MGKENNQMGEGLPIFSESKLTNPRKLFLFSTPKTGKTEAIAGLESNLIVDTENGSGYVNGIKWNLQEQVKATGKHPVTLLKGLSELIKAKNEEIKGFMYDYISIDTVTGLETYARELATILYKETAMGKNYSGNDVITDLPQGGGYLYLRKAFAILYGYFDGLAKEALILIGHVKPASIIKDGKDISATDIDLTGKLKQILCADSDAIGILRRNKDDSNQLMVSFKTDYRDLVTGARSPHLRNAEFALTELKDNEFTYHWDKIFI